jgi:excisionase family DNA binding protein
MSDRISYDLKEAAEKTGLSVRTLWRRIADGALPAKKHGRTTLIRYDDLRPYIDALPDARKSAQS